MNRSNEIEYTSENTPAKETPKKKRARGYYALSDRITNFVDSRVIERRDRELSSNTSRLLVYAAAKNPITRTMFAAMRHIKSIPMNFYGTVGAVFGTYIILIYFIKMYALAQFTATTSHLVLGGILLLLSFPLIFSSRPISHIVRTNKLMSLIFFDLFGLPMLASDSEVRKASGTLAFLIGTLLGIVAFFVNPYIIAGIIFGTVYVLMSFYSPEFCFTTSLIALPFMSVFTDHPTVLLCILICLCSVSYIIKIAFLKRVFHIELLDLFVLAFGAVYLISGIASVIRGGSFVPTAAFLCLSVGGYFLAANLLKGDISIRRTVRSMIFSSAIVSLIGLIEQFFGLAVNDWIDRDLFPDIAGRVTSTFSNPNVLGEFLTISVPLSLCSFFISKRFWGKFFAAIAFSLSIAAAIYTWSRGTWIALIVCCAVFAIAANFKSIIAIVLLGGLVPLSAFVLPDSIVERFLSSFNTVDSSIAYRLQIWRSCAEAALDNLLFGIGPGGEAFNSVYPEYAAPGAEVAEHSHNLFLQLLLECGLPTLILFLAVIAVFIFASTEYRAKDRTRSFRYLYAAGISVFVSLCVFGIADHVWYDQRILFLFWIALGFSSSVRNWYRERKAVLSSEQPTPYAFAVNIPLKKEKNK